MSTRLAWFICVLVFASGSVATWSLTRGQAPTPTPLPSLPPLPGDAPSGTPLPAVATPSPSTPPAPPAPAVEKSPAKTLSPLAEQFDYGARRGTEWLARMHDVKGRFHHGIVPSLNALMEGDHYLRQVGAALALARAARYTGDKGYEVRATQAVLTLLDETVVDPANPEVRYTPLPSTAVHRLASAGLLVSAVSELPSPREDLVEKAEQLCAYLRRQQRAEGGLCADDDEKGLKDPDRIAEAVGPALYGLMRSHKLRPAPWKPDAVKKALAFYAPWWRGNKNPAFVPWHTAAYVEAYLATRDKAFAEFVGEMNDWLCELQYERIDPRHPEWLGGFFSWADGKPLATAPSITSASYAESLAEACRLTRETADLPRFERYSATMERCLQFLMTLQYNEANTKYFVDWYRPRLLGGFHATHQNGDLRIDYTQHAVCAMMHYLTHVAR